MVSDAKKAANKKYEQSEKRKIVSARYERTKKCKIAHICYDQSKAGKISAKQRSARYQQTEKCKLRDIRYQQSEKGKIANARVSAKRKELGYKPINNWFPGCNGHHIDKENVLFIPEELHESIRHKQSNPISMKAINDAAFEWLCTQEII